MLRLFGLGSNPKTFEFRCKDCGEMHRGSPSISYDMPVQYFQVPEPERSARVKISNDLCRILPAHDDPDDVTSYFIRATLEIPIHGAPEPFCWGVWVSQSKTSFERYVETYDQDQSGDGSFGWLAVAMRPYVRHSLEEPFESLECNVEWGAPGKRPQVLIKECDHPLYADQHDGISWDRAIEIARAAFHG
jgi:hypothetical protein